LSSGIADELWQDLKDDRIWSERSSKLSLNRFQSIVHHAVSEAPLWSKRFLGLAYCSIQLGIMSRTLVRKLEQARLEAKSAIDGKETTARDELAGLRKHTVNTLAIATIFYADWENRAKQRLIATICEPVLLWHSDTDRETSVEHACTL
jgi:hypothetical protein